MLTQNKSSFVGTMKGVPEEEEEEGAEEEWSSLTTPPPRLPSALIREGAGPEEEELWSAIPEPPDGGWGWVIVAASFFCNMVIDGIAYSFGIFLIHFVHHYHASKGRTAWVGSLLAGSYLLVGPVVSGLTNKFGCRPVAITGSIISCVAFLLSTVAPTVDVLMLTYGLSAGIGFGLIYLPAIVSVGFYFSRKRAFATGLAVCGSGLGAFIFAPLTQALLEAYNWKGALLILAGFALNCAVFGALMRPLDLPAPKPKQNGKVADTAFKDSGLVLVCKDDAIIPLINTEPGVQSTLNLDQVPRQNSLIPSDVAAENMRNSIDMVPCLKVSSVTPTDSTQNVDGASVETLTEDKTQIKQMIHLDPNLIKDLQQRRFTMPATMPTVSSSGTICSNPNNNYGDKRRDTSRESFLQSKRQQRRLSSRKDLARPLYRKDIFYSGSIVNLPQYRESKADLRCYISSVTNIPQPSDDEEEDSAPKASPKKKRSRCPRLPRSMTDTLKEALDFSLLLDPAFLVICVANILGMLGFYVPFVYITDSSVEKGVTRDAAALLLSVIGITNLLGRLIFGWVVDKTRFKALDINNMCLAVSGTSIVMTPFCFSYASIMVSCSVFSLFVSAYISLTSIILVEMVGLDRLTNSFGLLSLFRGAASILGPPIAGSIYDWTGSYDIPFYMAGGLLISSGVLTFFIPWINKRPMANAFADPGVSGDVERQQDPDPTTAL